MSSITVEQYSEKAIVVRGNTIPYKDKLLSIGGKWNKMLKGGEGWIFPLTKKPIVEKLLSEPASVHDNETTEKNNESITKTRTYKKNLNENMSTSEVVLTKKEYLHLISRIEKLEQLIMNIDEKSIKTIKKNIPPPLSSINDSDLNVDNYEDDEEDREQPVQRLLRKRT